MVSSTSGMGANCAWSAAEERQVTASTALPKVRSCAEERALEAALAKALKQVEEMPVARQIEVTKEFITTKKVDAGCRREYLFGSSFRTPWTKRSTFIEWGFLLMHNQREVQWQAGGRQDGTSSTLTRVSARLSCAIVSTNLEMVQWNTFHESSMSTSIQVGSQATGPPRPNLRSQSRWIGRFCCPA